MYTYDTHIFFELYAFIILTSTLALGINYFVIITRPLHPIPVRKRIVCSMNPIHVPEYEY